MSIAEKLQTIAENEQKVYNAGYEKGKSEGGDTETAYNNGFKDGKTAEWNEFWNNYQEYGKKSDFSYAFAGLSWTDETFKPKYDIVPLRGTHVFSNNKITDLVARLNEAGVVLDMSKCDSITYLIQGNTYTTTLPVLDIRNIPKIPYFISGNSALQYIEKIILRDDGSQEFNDYSIRDNTALEYIRFEGVIGKSISFIGCSKLNKASIENIIGCLSENATGQTATFSQTAVNKAFGSSESDEWENLIAQKSNWEISLM